MENNKENPARGNNGLIDKNIENPQKGLNDWNDRLDENLEPEEHNDVVADENAKDFSEKYGSGDQSDESND